MKKVILFAAMAALTITAYGQEAKAAPVPSAPVSISTPSERPLSETEALRIQLSIANLKVLQAKHKTDEIQKRMDEFQAEAKPIIDEQQSIIVAACKSVGVAKEKMQDECGLSTGIGDDGRPIIGSDGKPAQPKVWKKIPEVKK